MADSVDSLHGQILDAAIAYAVNHDTEASKDERSLQSTVGYRTAAAENLKDIRRLVRILLKKEQTYDTSTEVG